MNVKDLKPKKIEVNRAIKPLDIDLSIFFFLAGMGRFDFKSKDKINKWNYMKLKGFCTAKETINKIKSTPVEW